jgi:hypothetical protein
MEAAVARRGFDHLFAELSVALGQRAPRYPLWLRIGEMGVDPAALGRDEAVSFCRSELPSFLTEQSLALSRRAQRTLLKRVERFQPSHQTPAEHMERMIAPRGS